MLLADFKEVFAILSEAFDKPFLKLKIKYINGIYCSFEIFSDILAQTKIFKRVEVSHVHDKCLHYNTEDRTVLSIRISTAMISNSESLS